MSECTGGGGGGIGRVLQLCLNESSKQGNSICSPSVEDRSLAGRTTGLLKLHPPHPPLTTLRSSGLPLDRALTEHCASKPRNSTEEREGSVGTPTLCNVLGTRRNLSTPPVAWRALFIQYSYLLCHKTRTAADTDILKPDAGAFPSFCDSFFFGFVCLFVFNHTHNPAQTIFNRVSQRPHPNLQVTPPLSRK